MPGSDGWSPGRVPEINVWSDGKVPTKSGSVGRVPTNKQTKQNKKNKKTKKGLECREGTGKPRVDLQEECQKTRLENRNGAGKRRFECRNGTGRRVFDCRKGSGKRVGGEGGGCQEECRKAKFGVPKVYQTRRVKGWLAEGEDSNAGMVPGSAGRMRFDFRYLKKEMF